MANIEADDDMTEPATFTRREVNSALLALALTVAGASRAGARKPEPLFDFAIAGGFYHGLDAALERIKPGMFLALGREADNPHDGDAVAVWLDGVKLGYIPRAANSPVARLLDRGETVTAQVIRMLDMKKASDVPEELVFTAFTSGDPMIRLTA